MLLLAKPSSLDDPMVLTVVIIMLILLLVIGLLAHLVVGAAGYFRDRQKEQEEKAARQNESTVSPAAVLPVVIGLLLLSAPVFAQDAQAPVQAVQSAGALSGTALYLVIGVIVLELLVIFGLLFQLRTFFAKERAARPEADAADPRRWQLLWDKFNSLRPITQESQLDLGHEYDGIRELNNRLPRWWLYGFYGTIVFAGIYLWQHHVSHTALLSGDEYRIAMKEADEQHAAYLKTSANNVDENSVKLLTDAGGLEGGKGVFEKNCVACHGTAGQGIVGPNLTDDYWLHGGSVHDIFKTVKYGWTKKGMKSWKEDLSPVQIAQVVSYIKSLHGSNPPNAKEKQGDLYQEAGDALPAGDTTAASRKIAVTNDQK